MSPLPVTGRVGHQRTSGEESLVVVGFDDAPPRPLPDRFDAVRIGAGLGIPAMRSLLDSDEAGPYLVCRQHRAVVVPVPLGTADRWVAPHSECVGRAAIRRLRCVAGSQPTCRSRVWIAPPRPVVTSRTMSDPDALYHALSLVRLVPRSEVCCA